MSTLDIGKAMTQPSRLYNKGRGLKYGVAVAMLTFGLTAGAQAAPWVIDFDTAGDGSTISNGQIIDDEYAAQIFGAKAGLGVTISVHNNNNPAVAFPSNNDYPDNTPTHEDTDLRHVAGDGINHDGGNNHAGENFRNILIIQEQDDHQSGSNHDAHLYGGDQDIASWQNNSNFRNCSAIECESPDDNAGGGYLIFDFTEAVNLTGLDYFDIDNSESGKVYLFNEGESWGDAGVDIVNLDVVGDGGVGFAGFEEKGQNIVKMKVYFEHSGAVDNIQGQAPGGGGEVPEPGTLAIFGVGLLGLGLARRRRNLVA